MVSGHVLAMFAPAFFTGSLIARFGAERVIAAGLVILAAAGAVALSGVGFGHFAVAMVLLGLGWNFGFIGSTAMLAAAHTPRGAGAGAGDERLRRLRAGGARLARLGGADELLGRATRSRAGSRSTWPWRRSWRGGGRADLAGGALAAAAGGALRAGHVPETGGEVGALSAVRRIRGLGLRPGGSALVPRAAARARPRGALAGPPRPRHCPIGEEAGGRLGSAARLAAGWRS